jgi:hypothetical protein
MVLAALPAFAQTVDVTDANALITANQYNNAFGGPTSMSIISANGKIDESFVGVLTDTFTGSTVGTMNNTVSSSVLGNEAVLSIVSTVNTDTAGGAGADVTAGQTYDNRIRADADADANLAIGVVQGNNEVISSATTTNTIASVNTGAVGTSTIDVTGNIQRASGALNLAQNTITTTANGSDMTAGIASSQVNEDSSLTLTSAALAGVRVGDAVTEGATGSTLTVSGNTQSAFGAGNSATNTVTATITNAELTPVVGSSLSSATNIGGGTPGTSAMGGVDVLATYAIANAQTQDDVTLRAITDGAGNGFELSVAGNVGTSTLVNDSNTASSSIRGNEATSTVNLTLTNVVTGLVATPAPGTVAAIGNAQNVDGTISATTMGAAGLAVETAIGGTLDDSTVSTSSNTVSASATANTGANRIVVQANDVDTGLTVTPGAVVSPTIVGAGQSVATSTAAFAVSSTQQAQGSVTASLVDNATTPTSGARIETSVDGNISESTITSDLNTLRATATGNEITPATNAITITGTNVQTTTAVANNQSLLADVSAVIGVEGGTQTITNTFTVSGTGDGTTATVPGTGYNTDEFDAVRGFLETQFGAANVSVSGSNFVVQTGLLTFSFAPTLSYTTNVPSSGGVIIAAGANITDSTLSVDGNRTEGEVTGNTATNRILVDAANIAQGSALTTANANVDYTTFAATASADNALTNSQTIGGAVSGPETLSTSVAGAFAITQVPTTAVDGSTLSVSGNTQMATTTGNEGVNQIALSATNLDTTAALLSVQSGDAAASATSTMEVYAPAATVDSTVDMNRNVNQAVATLNTVNNAVSVTAANITSASNGANAVLDSTVSTTATTQGATADNVLNNVQIASTSVAATANTTVVNGDGGIGFPVPYATAGINTSTISLDANRTVAQSTANNAVNTMALNGGATLAATGGVLNQQLSSATSTATASSDVALVIADGTNAAVDRSSISIDGNRTTAAASGNVASNALNVSALSLTVTGAGSSALNGGVATGPEGTNSTYGVLNAQGNAGAVTATVTAVNYGGIFAGSLATSPVVDASSLTLNGNSVGASAVGNSASNSLTLAALNYGTSSAAIGNEQGNTADITATITEARLVLNPIGGVGSSTLSAVGNTISSSAVGNSVSSSLIRN